MKYAFHRRFFLIHLLFRKAMRLFHFLDRLGHERCIDIGKLREAIFAYDRLRIRPGRTFGIKHTGKALPGAGFVIQDPVLGASILNAAFTRFRPESFLTEALATKKD